MLSDLILVSRDVVEDLKGLLKVANRLKDRELSREVQVIAADFSALAELLHRKCKEENS